MTREQEAVRLSHIAVHPVKALDPVTLERVGITDIGGLDNDRACAIVTGDGEYLNGKRTDAVHRIRADIDIEQRQLLLDAGGSAPAASEFHLDRDRTAIESWLSAFFDEPVTLETDRGGSLTDGVIYGDEDQTGPTLVSAATLRELSSWYDDIEPDEMRLRLRPNLVVAGVPPFWEDRLVADGGRALRIGGVRLEVTHPVPRCVVPTRDPHTGVANEGFRETFVERRKATLPGWADRAEFENTLFSVTVGTRVPETERDGELRVGDEVQVL